MATINPDALANVTTFQSLVKLLKDQLDWPFGEVEEPENYVFEWDAAELGLKADEVAKIREIKQLRPLVTHQPWGVFFISFEDKALSVTVLRRLLRNLVRRKRDSAQSAERQAWHQNDLIFATNFGASGHRELAFIHFSDEGKTNDLPVMKVLGWNAHDTVLHNQYAANMLQQRLRWPDDDKDENKWRGQWAGAFEVSHNQVINTSKDLAIRLAALAQEMRARANQLLKAETDKGPMRAMLAAFRKNLIQDLDEDGFADMFAQTIAYGFLAAHISRPSGGLVADNLVDMVPKTNPFLRELFGTFLSLGGRDKGKNLDFDELGVRDVVDMLANANMEAVLRDFGDRNPKEDPVIHFYELFLKQYDPKKRMQRGVFYTPRPVVNFIVRGVDEILRSEFGLELGLADTTTWGELAKRNDKITVPAHIKPETPFVQILDPATGTGTFLVEVIDLIYKRMEAHWNEQELSVAKRKQLWNEYVPQHLLPRLTGFELMMAPYAIAHMKVGLKLSETGYSFGSDERARIFLTNALEPARDLDMEFMFMSEALAHEAQAANDAKAKTQSTVIVGNPPYSGTSANLTEQARSLVGRYKFIDGVRIRERGALQFEKNLQDDYVKFIAQTEDIANKNTLSVVGLVTSNGYIDNPTLRGLRKSLLQTFDAIQLLNLFGNVNRGDEADDGSKDENIFEIANSGVAIFLGLKDGSAPSADAKLAVAGLQGDREEKYNFLVKRNANAIGAKVVRPIQEFYQFLILDSEVAVEFREWFGTPKLFPLNSIGIITARDFFVIDHEKETLVQRVNSLRSSKLLPTEACNHFYIPLKKGWDHTKAIRNLREVSDIESHVSKVLYRPFDVRHIFYHLSLIWGMANPVMRNMQSDWSLALISSRMTKGEDFAHATVSEGLSEVILLSSKTSNNAFSYPLWLKPSAGETHRRPNIDRNLALAFGTAIVLTYEDGIPRGGQTSFGDDFRKTKPQQTSLLDATWDGRGDLQNSFGPRDLFDWIYAVLHAPSYRTRYADFLKSDFPRIPTPGSRDLFAKLVALGHELVALHLLKPDEAPILKAPAITFHGSGEARVAKGYPEYVNGKVMINANRWFEDVPKATWEFHVGGYQVLEKWLKDRAEKGGKNPKPGRVLTDEDILHYRRVVVALTETRRIMTDIDKTIESHGGWPGAFGGANGKAQ